MEKQFAFIIFLLCCSTCLYAQTINQPQKPAKSKQLVGTWRLIEFADLDLNGKWIFPYGENPKGYFTYTKSGIVNLNISSSVPLRITEDSAQKYFPNLEEYIWHTALGYFGFYSVDWKKSIVTHHVKGGSIPYYIEKRYINNW